MTTLTVCAFASALGALTGVILAVELVDFLSTRHLLAEAERLLVTP